MVVSVLEKLHNKEVWIRKEIESLHNRKANTYYEGINLKP
jgi:hypothetical protein